MKKILLIRLRELGDTLMVTPLIRQLKRIYPESSIDVVCEPRSAPILEHHPLVDDLLLLNRASTCGESVTLLRELRSRRYDLAIDSQSLPKTAILTRLSGAKRRVGFKRRGVRNRLCYTAPYRTSIKSVEYIAITNLKLIQDERVDLADLQPDFYICDADRDKAERFCHEYFRGPVVAVSPTSRFSYRRWPLEKFAELADRLVDRGFQPFLVYGPGEEGQLALQVARKMRHAAVVDYPMMSFPVLKGIMERCVLFTGLDGGPKAIARACGLPTLTLYGLVHPEGYTDPSSPDQRFIATRPDSRPMPVQGGCTNYATLSEIPVDVVWSEIERLITDGYVPEPIQWRLANDRAA